MSQPVRGIPTSRLAWLPLLGAGLIALAAACAAPSETPEAVPEEPAVAGDPGRIVGRLTAGPARDPDRPIDFSSDPVCRGLHPEEVIASALVTDADSRVANAFVYLSEGVHGDWPVPEEPLLLDQVGCLFLPRVQGVRAGQTVIARNSDPTLHNVLCQPRLNSAYAIGQPFQGMEAPMVFESPEVMIEITCDVHPWMKAWIGVVGHPFFAVSGEDGSFAIDGVPPGSYRLTAWHEVLEPATVDVVVPAGGEARVELTLAGATPAGR